MKSKVIIAVTLVVAFFTALAADAHTTDVMGGTIGPYKVKMKLYLPADFASGKVTGWYYYVSKGSKNKIALTGYYDASTHELALTEKSNGKVTGHFQGEYCMAYTMGYIFDQFWGTWSSPTGKTLEFFVNNS